MSCCGALPRTGRASLSLSACRLTLTTAMRVRQLAGSDSARPISVVLFAGAIVALVGNPIFGALSDRTRSRFGRRRPYLVGGALCGFAALALIGVATSLNLVLIGWCLAQ